MSLGQGLGVNSVAWLCAFPGSQCLACMGELFCLAHVVQNFKFESVALRAQGLGFGAAILIKPN